MRKMSTLVLFLGIIVICFSSCRVVNSYTRYGTLKHEHIVHEWQYSGEHHWRGATCTWSKCDIDPRLDNHVDEDKNDVYDICGARHEHIFGEWQYDERDHWCSAYCTWNGCDIDTYAEHYDKDDNNLCDACEYEMNE